MNTEITLNVDQVAIQSNLNQLIEQVRQAEEVTYAALSQLSRDMLAYIPDSGDIDMANRLIAVLKADRALGVTAYFEHFLPWHCEDGVFSTKIKKAARVEKKAEERMAFLEIEANNYYTWKREENASKNPKDFAALITKAVVNGTNEEKGDLSNDAVLTAVLAGGVTLTDLAAFLANQEEVALEEVAAIRQVG